MGGHDTGQPSAEVASMDVAVPRANVADAGRCADLYVCQWSLKIVLYENLRICFLYLCFARMVEI